MTMGPNVKRLVSLKLALLLVPSSTPEGRAFGAAVRVLTDADSLKAAFREAAEWVELAIKLVKAAVNNPYGDDDEAIAGAILGEIEAKGGKP